MKNLMKSGSPLCKIDESRGIDYGLSTGASSVLPNQARVLTCWQ